MSPESSASGAQSQTRSGHLLVVGSTGLDTIHTPLAQVMEVLGGSSTYFSIAASFFTNVRLVSVVGNDFPKAHRELLRRFNVDLDGLEVAAGETFRWTGRYMADMNTRETLETQLNVFGDFDPKVPEAYRKTPYVFLANGAPHTQASVLRQVEKPKFVVIDTMNLWINQNRQELEDLLQQVDALVINDEEAEMLSGKSTMLTAAKEIIAMGPRTLIIKKGSHGAMLFQETRFFALPAFPLDMVNDPTGAGDSFAGAFMGYLAATDSLDHDNLRRALAYGTVTAAFTCQDFSVRALERIRREDLDRRMEMLRDMTHF
jgi:sugar/nucleoside kinase (ribokinase family)